MCCVVAVIAVGSGAPLTAQAIRTPLVLEALPGSTLTIRGSTSIGVRWHCTATNIEARVAVAMRAQGDTAALPDVRGLALHVPVSQLKCQSGAMERAMRRAIKADRDTAAQIISGRFDIVDASVPTPNRRHLFGTLRVAGVERNIFLSATVDRGADSSLHVRSSVPLTLSAFGIAPPRVLLGAVRARDAIVVEVSLNYPDPLFNAILATSTRRGRR